MVWIRRLIAICTAFASGLFGAIAASPAHAHDHAAAGAVHAIALDAHANDYGHDHQGEDADHSRPDGGDDPMHSESEMHAHAFPQFAPVSDAELPAPTMWSAVTPEPLSAGAVSRAAAPPLRPPRAFL